MPGVLPVHTPGLQSPECGVSGWAQDQLSTRYCEPVPYPSPSLAPETGWPDAFCDKEKGSEKR